MLIIESGDASDEALCRRSVAARRTTSESSQKKATYSLPKVILLDEKNVMCHEHIMYHHALVITACSSGKAVAKKFDFCQCASLFVHAIYTLADLPCEQLKIRCY